MPHSGSGWGHKNFDLDKSFGIFERGSFRILLWVTGNFEREGTLVKRVVVFFFEKKREMVSLEAVREMEKKVWEYKTKGIW